MAKNTNDPTRIVAYRDFVPDVFRFWGTILIALIYLFSGAVQLASAGQQVSLLSLLQEDTQMIGYSAFVGMNMIFPILFNIRFRYSTKSIFTAVTIVLIICHFCTLFTTNVFLLCSINFIAGSFRMLGAFEAMVIIQLTITPTRSYAMFYSVIFFIVQGSALFFGAQVAYILDYFSIWHLHWIIILLLLWVQWMVFTFFRHYRSMKKIPLYGIDWSGYILWCITLFLILFIVVYGKYFEWFGSIYISMAFLLFVVVLLLNIYHMLHIKRPYISREAWKYKNLWELVFIFLILYILLSTSSALQNGYMSGILHYDSLHVVFLNGFVLGGMAVSAFLCYVWFVRYNKPVKPMIFIGFLSVVMYLFSIYCSIDPRANIEIFYFPAFFRGFGLLLLYIVLTIYIAGIVPFKHNFQVLCIIGFIRMSLGTAIGSSIIDNWTHYLMVKNNMILGAELDRLNLKAESMSVSSLVGELNRQVMMVSMKEIYGWMLLVGIIMLVIIFFDKDIRTIYQFFYPKIKTIRHRLKRSVDSEIKEKQQNL